MWLSTVNMRKSKFCLYSSCKYVIIVCIVVNSGHWPLLSVYSDNSKMKYMLFCKYLLRTVLLTYSHLIKKILINLKGYLLFSIFVFFLQKQTWKIIHIIFLILLYLENKSIIFMYFTLNCNSIFCFLFLKFQQKEKM